MRIRGVLTRLIAALLLAHGCKTGEQVIKQGDDGDFFYIVEFKLRSGY